MFYNKYWPRDQTRWVRTFFWLEGKGQKFVRNWRFLWKLKWAEIHHALLSQFSLQRDQWLEGATYIGSALTMWKYLAFCAHNVVKYCAIHSQCSKIFHFALMMWQCVMNINCSIYDIKLLAQYWLSTKCKSVAPLR